MAKKNKTVTIRQTIYLNKTTGHFVSAKYAKTNPSNTLRKPVTIKKNNQKIITSKATGRFVSAKYAKANPAKTVRGSAGAKKKKR